MSNINSENLSGVINWVNKNFTFSQTPTTILNIYVDWAEVFSTDFSITWNIITFTDSPLYSVRWVYIVGAWQALNNTEILIPNEVPTGVINWINKVYTCNNIISSVLSVIKDWVETTDFTTSWSNIIFSVAPLYNVLVDYITSSEGVDSADLAWNTSQDKIISRIYNDILKVSINSTVFKLDTTKEFINEIQSSLLMWDYIDLTWKKHRETKYSFLYKKQYLNILDTVSNVISDSQVGESINTWSNTFTSWYVYINWNVIKYNSNVSWVLSGLSWQSRNVKQWDKVTEVFKLDINNFKTVDVWVDFWSVWYKLLYKDETNRSLKTWYTVINDYYNNKYIKFEWVDNWAITITYLRNIPNISTTINSIIPWDYGIKILPYMVAARHLQLWDEFNKRVEIERIWLQAYEQLKYNYSKDFVEMNDIIWNDDLPYYY